MDAGKAKTKKTSPRTWEPKTSDCYLVTGGQLKRLRDAQTYDERNEIVQATRFQKYRSKSCTLK